MTIPSEETARSPAAERMRRHRESRRDGLRCLTIELRVTEIEALVRIGLLKAETRNDQNAIREALYEYLDQTFRHPHWPPALMPKPPIAFWLFMAIIADMNRGGSKPGERRGGRKKGSLNKATIERALMAEREIATASETRQKLAKDHLEELVDFYARMSISEPDEVEKWSKLRMEAASRLAPYQSPKLGVVMIEPPSEQDRLAQMTDEELIAALNSKADALGVEITIKPKGRRQLTLVPNNKSEECDG